MKDVPSRPTPAQTEVEDLTSRLAAIVDSSNDAIISKDLNGVISTWNRAAVELLGYSEAEAIGQRITILIPHELLDEEADILRRVRAGERIEHYETRRITRDGRILDVSLTISPIRDAQGTIIGASKILRDITETRRAHAALRESEQRLAREVAGARTLHSISTRLISELTEESLFSQILDAAIELMCSDAASIQMLGQDGTSLTLLAWKNFHPCSATFWERVDAEVGSSCGVALRDNVRVLVTDVEACDFMAGTKDLEEYRRSGIRAVQSTPLQSRVGRPIGMISTHWHAPHTPTEDDFMLFDVLARQAADLIERVRSENAIRESEERFRLIANTAPVIIWMSDASKDCTYINQTGLEFSGQPIDASLGNRWMARIHPEDVVQLWDIYSRAFDQRERFQADFRLRRHDGEYRSVVGTGAPRHHGDGSFAGYIGSAIDVTEHRLAEEALVTVNQRLVDAQEEERARIARELHDDVVQRLVALSLRLHVSKRTGPVSTTDISRELEEACEEIHLAKDVQALSHRLHPKRLEYFGIATAAKALCREMSSQGVEISFHAENVPEGLPRPIAMCLYRVLQETLQNAIKHSEAERIDVSLGCQGDEIELTVRDFGSGFDIQDVKRSGLGLTSIKERLKGVQGELFIRSQPRQGTTIHVCVPLALDDQETPRR